MSIPTLDLDKIQDIAQVSEGKAKKLRDTCVWCLDASNHSNGVTLAVDDNKLSVSYVLNWPSSLDLATIKTSFNQDDAVEEGAEAVAILLAIERTDFTAVERASTGTGIDYWLGYKDNPPNNPFERAGRLEVSGILKESETNTIAARVTKKLKQTLPTDHTFAVYVIIVEFDRPYAIMVVKK